ncbi:MAG: UDP-N-acetylglucosamine 2-epimerase [Candidatus Nanoarchaeia archaeon]|nr:UDP-N-acetylglucosamine 2-epimerase [Candidatus Nanoarchaeia archaeon]MDD5587628.1 UDP-N-acetylglucosamine 2-epimerase [Candidatus Nanoarchaeia archaeon]
MSFKIDVKPGTFERLKKDKRPLHVVLIGTKPDIIKQAPLILKLKERKENVIVVHTGQHYDWNLSKGLEQEFNIHPDINLNVRGSTLFEQHSQIIERFGSLICKLKQINDKIIPYAYSDTTTAAAGAIASFTNRIAVAHVEAGLRTMSPPKELTLDFLLKGIDTRSYFNKLMKSKNWTKGSYEPYPEQFDTKIAAPCTGIHLAPVELNRQNLLNEGYEKERIFVVGNPVADAIEITKKRIKESNIYERYPQLDNGNFIRFCVHRRENVCSRQRFKSAIMAMEKLVKSGKNVLFISLGATERALSEFGLHKRISDLAKTHKNLIYSPVWPFYVDVIAAMKKCTVIATDSGSIQEEANVLGIPCATLRFNTERPETVFNGANIIVPPIREDIIFKMLSDIHEDKKLNRSMARVGNLYGKNVSENIINRTNELIEKGPLFELLEHERLGFSKLYFWDKGDIKW